jgi:hypothetical protein
MSLDHSRDTRVEPRNNPAHEHVYLLGWPSLEGMLEHVNRVAADRPVDDRDR